MVDSKRIRFLISKFKIDGTHRFDSHRKKMSQNASLNSNILVTLFSASSGKSQITSMKVCPCLCRHGLRGVTKTECVGGVRLCWRSIGRLASRRTSLSYQRGGDAIRRVNAVPTDYQSRRRDGQDSIHFPHRADLPQALLHQRVFPRAIRARQMPKDASRE